MMSKCRWPSNNEITKDFNDAFSYKPANMEDERGPSESNISRM